jgi:hypothetical protein
MVKPSTLKPTMPTKLADASSALDAQSTAAEAASSAATTTTTTSV